MGIVSALRNVAWATLQARAQQDAGSFHYGGVPVKGSIGDRIFEYLKVKPVSVMVHEPFKQQQSSMLYLLRSLPYPRSQPWPIV